MSKEATSTGARVSKLVGSVLGLESSQRPCDEFLVSPGWPVSPWSRCGMGVGCDVVVG